MDDEDEQAFHLRRAEQERAAAAASSCMARTAHLDLAEEHLEIAQALAREGEGEVAAG